MSKEPTKRELLEAAAKRAAEQQPDEIHLNAAPEHVWTNPGAVETQAAAIRALGFADAGTYTVNVLPVAIRFFLMEFDQMYATVYEHPKAGVWINFVVLYEDGSSITFSNTQDRGLEKRPGHPTVYSTGASAAQLYVAAHRQSPLGKRKQLTATSIITEFEKAWADSTRWRKNRGISMTEVTSVIVSRDKQDVRVLRPDRIHFVPLQDGEPELELKELLVQLFNRHQTVAKAYLVSATYDESPQAGIALCLAAADPKDAELVAGIRNAFAGLFQESANPRILFVVPSDLPRLERVCKPFYTRTSH